MSESRSQWRSRTLEERTDRLARRLWTLPVERDTYRWARLRVAVASHDLMRAIQHEAIPAVRRVGASMDRAAEQMRRFAEALKPPPPAP